MRISKSELVELAAIGSVESISISTLQSIGESEPQEIYLHANKNVGVYLHCAGVLLEPIYTEIMRCGDIFKVGLRSDQTILYGCYSITERKLIFPIRFTSREFWEQLKLYRSSA